MSGHAAGSVTHRHAAEQGAADIHQAGRGGDAVLGNRPIRKQAIVLFTNRDDGVAQRQRQLRQSEEDGTEQQVVPREAGQRQIGQA